MTFDEYNTDEVFKGDSTADELVKKGYDEGKSREEIETSLSPLWKEDKKGNVKKALDKYYKVETPKKEEVKETAEPSNETKTKSYSSTQTDSDLNKADKDYMYSQFAITDEAKRKAINDAVNEKAAAFNNTLDTLEKQGEAYKQVEDHYLDALPTFSFHRFINGEFGDPKGKDAKIRLAYYMINGLQSKLKTASNLAMANAGRSPMFSDTRSDFEKFQESNFNNALENRWNKYKKETDNAMSLLANRGYKEEELTDAARTISENQNLQTAFNMVDENKKAYILEVVTKLGNKIGNMNDKSFVNLILGMASSGTVDPSQAAEMIGIRAGGSLADKYNLFDDNGNLDLSVIKNLVSTLGKESTGSILKGYGIDLDKLNLDGKSEGGESDTGATLEDGTKIDPGKYMNSKEYKELVAAGDKLSNQYYNGEIDEEKFRSEYAKLEKIMSEHGWFSFFRNKGIKSADDLIKVNNQNNLIRLSDDLDKLNSNAKNLTKDEYTTQYNKLKESAIKWGITDKQLNAMESDYKKYLKKAKSK